MINQKLLELIRELYWYLIESSPNLDLLLDFVRALLHPKGRSTPGGLLPPEQ